MRAQINRVVTTCSLSLSFSQRVCSTLPRSNAGAKVEAAEIAHPQCWGMDGHSRSQNYSQENQEQISLYHREAVQTPYSSFYPASSASDDLTSLDCETEDGLEVSEGETVKLPPARTSSSKRNRAAEVHNLSEKRRRSRINEKLKALQALIPNSSKTDKASILDEAIEYLKQLQLQVQVLSVRNSLGQHPMYMSGALQPLQASQMGFIDLGTESGITSAVGILHLDQGASVPYSSNLQTSSHESASMPSVVNTSRPVTSSPMEESTFLPMSIEDILSRETTQYQQPNAMDFPRNNYAENAGNSTDGTASGHSRGICRSRQR